MRVKDSADDYRFLPDPDIVPLHISEEWIERVRAEIPELPDARKQRYVEEFDLPAYDAEVLPATIEMANFFEEAVAEGADAKQASNWIMRSEEGDVGKELKHRHKR